MQLSEKEVENFIYEDLNLNYGQDLSSRGMTLPSTGLVMSREEGDVLPPIEWFQQFNLDPYGVADIVGYYRWMGVIYIDIIELKAVELKVQDFEQLCRYRRAIERRLNNTFKRVSSVIRMHLVGTSYDGFYLHNLIPVTVYTYTYGLNGIMFDKVGAYPSYFHTQDKSKSFKHLFNGQKVH